MRVAFDRQGLDAKSISGEKSMPICVNSVFCEEQGMELGVARCHCGNQQVSLAANGLANFAHFPLLHLRHGGRFIRMSPKFDGKIQ